MGTKFSQAIFVGCIGELQFVSLLLSSYDVLLEIKLYLLISLMSLRYFGYYDY